MILDGIRNKKVFQDKINNNQISKPLKLSNNVKSNDSNLELLNIFDSNVSFTELKNKIFPIISEENRIVQPNHIANLKYYIRAWKNDFHFIIIKNRLFASFT